MDEDDYELVTVANTRVLPPATTTSDNRNNLSTAATTNPIEVMQAKPQSTGKSRAMMLVALIATIAIMVLAIIVILVIFSPQSSGSNSELEAIKQQIENLRMSMSQIQQSNASSLQGTFEAEISRQSIQDMIDNSIQQLKVQINNSQLSIQGVREKVKYTEQNIKNMVENLTLSLTQNFEEVIHETKSNVSQVFEQLEIQLADTHA